jgi:hypothetical protein
LTFLIGLEKISINIKWLKRDESALKSFFAKAPKMVAKSLSLSLSSDLFLFQKQFPSVPEPVVPKSTSRTWVPIVASVIAVAFIGAVVYTRTRK